MDPTKIICLIHSKSIDLFSSEEYTPFLDQQQINHHSLPSPDDNDEHTTPAPNLGESKYLAISTDQLPRIAERGYCWGRNSASDFRFKVDRKSGISGDQFSIIPNWAHDTWLIRNFSKYGTTLRCHSYGTVCVKEQMALPVEQDIDIVLGVLDIRLRFPDHAQHSSLWTANWNTYKAAVCARWPALETLNITSGTNPSITTLPDRSSQYDLLDIVGSGSSGVVRRAMHIQSGSVYAVKVYSEKVLMSESMKWGEITLLPTMEHAHIVKFHQFFIEEKANAMLVMEFIDGRNLEEELSLGHFTDPAIQVVAKQLFAAVAYLHTKNIAHRDIKPSNIMMQSRDFLKLTDFGLADRKSELVGYCGSRLYLAPEVEEHESYTVKVDIWSVGMVLLWLCRGLPPYPRSTKFWPDIIVSYIWLQQNTGQNSPIIEFLRYLLVVNPHERPSAANVIMHSYLVNECQYSSPPRPARKTSLRLHSATNEPTRTIQGASDTFNKCQALGSTASIIFDNVSLSALPDSLLSLPPSPIKYDSKRNFSQTELGADHNPQALESIRDTQDGKKRYTEHVRDRIHMPGNMHPTETWGFDSIQASIVAGSEEFSSDFNDSKSVQTSSWFPSFNTAIVPPSGKISSQSDLQQQLDWEESTSNGTLRSRPGLQTAQEDFSPSDQVQLLIQTLDGPQFDDELQWSDFVNESDDQVAADTRPNTQDGRGTHNQPRQTPTFKSLIWNEQHIIVRSNGIVRRTDFTAAIKLGLSEDTLRKRTRQCIDERSVKEYFAGPTKSEVDHMGKILKLNTGGLYLDIDTLERISDPKGKDLAGDLRRYFNTGQDQQCQTDPPAITTSRNYAPLPPGFHALVYDGPEVLYRSNGDVNRHQVARSVGLEIKTLQHRTNGARTVTSRVEKIHGRRVNGVYIDIATMRTMLRGHGTDLMDLVERQAAQTSNQLDTAFPRV